MPMFNRSFENFLAKDIDKKELYPYIYSINFRELLKAAKIIKTEPIKCSECGAVLTNLDLIKDDDKIGTNFKCEYCGTINVVERANLPASLPNDVDYIIEDVETIKEPEKDEQITKVAATEGELYIAVIDISGSMSGAKMQAVKKSLVQTLKDYKMNASSTKFILIPFESSVYYYLRHDSDAVRFSGDILHSLDGMKESLIEIIKEDTFVGSIGEFADGWVSCVERLNSMDMTALGPALFYATTTFQLLKMKKGGKITLLTDGLANQGIGNLSGSSIGAEKFYDQIADSCNASGIIVDIVGVSSPGDKNEMGLRVLGKITDKTGGQMFLISDQEMGAAFAELQQINYVGKDVKVKLITPKIVNIKNVSGAFSSKSVEEKEINLGAVTEDRELFVELNSLSESIDKNETIPIQLQVEYMDKEGRKRLRVINDAVSVTEDLTNFKAKYDQKLNVMMNIQDSGKAYYGGKGGVSKNRLTSLKSDMLNELNSLRGAGVKLAREEEYMESMEYLDDEIDEMQIEEEKVKSSPKSSFMAVMGQARSRISTEKLKKRMEKKRKK